MNKTRAYLYTVKDDHTINVQEGYIEHLWRSQSLFTSDTGLRYYVSTEPGTMRYQKLWMTIRNDDLVKQLYIEYHNRKIEELERNLKTHKQAISVLKGMKKHDL